MKEMLAYLGFAGTNAGVKGAITPFLILEGPILDRFHSVTF